MVNQSLNIDVHFHMEKGMYGRLVERAQELGVPLSAVVRDAVVQYFANIPEVAEQETDADPNDPIWELTDLSRSYGDLRAPNSTSLKLETNKEGR